MEWGLRLIPPTKAVSLSLPASMSQLFWCWQKPGLGAVPSDPNSRSANFKLTHMVHRSPKRMRFKVSVSASGRQKDDPDVDTTRRRPVQHVQCGSSTVGHFEGGPHESHGHPDTSSGRLNRLADTPEGRLAINQRPYEIPSAQGIGARLHKGNRAIVRHRGNIPIVPLPANRPASCLQV